MIVALDDRSPVPPFEQLRAQIDRLIRSGSLPSGSQLPPVRQLAGDLGVAPNTVARAYRELEAGGLVAGHGRRGTVVVWAAPAPDRSALDRAAARFLDEVKSIGASPAEAVAALQRRLLGTAG